MKLRNESSKYRLHVVLMFGKKTLQISITEICVKIHGPLN